MIAMLYKIISETLNIPAGSITPESSIKDIPNWDSLSHMLLILAIEKHYKLALTGEDIIRMTSIKEMEQVLQEKGVHTHAG